MRTRVRQYPPAKFVFAESGRTGEALDSLVSQGCIISGGQVKNCGPSPDVRVNSYSEVDSSILFSHVNVGRHCRIRRAILDRDVHIPEGTTIGFDAEADRQRYFVTESGITVVTRDYSLFENPMQSTTSRASSRSHPVRPRFKPYRSVAIASKFVIIVCNCSPAGSVMSAVAFSRGKILVPKGDRFETPAIHPASHRPICHICVRRRPASTRSNRRRGGLRSIRHLLCSQRSKRLQRGSRIAALVPVRQSRRAFENVAAKDPQCAMAYWGVAMSYYHGLWENSDLASGRTAWRKADQIASSNTKTTPREKAYIEALGELSPR